MATKTVLITGASKGIGKELARIHASKGDNLVLIARSADQLELLRIELEAQYKTIYIELLIKDLAKPESAHEVYEELQEKDIQIDYLINNAGIGEFGFFADTDWDRFEKMIDLNVKTLTHLCHLFLSDMIDRKQGRIMNVASTAAFQPGPMMAVYFATKSYVLHLSEALNNEAKEHGVTVTAFCPGPTDTHFVKDSKMEKSNMIKYINLSSTHAVALSGYQAMMKNQPVKIYGFFNRMIAFSVRLVPRKWVVSLSRKMQG